MLIYKDKTFCRHYKHCTKQFECGRALTFEVTMEAKSFGLPVATFTNRPECWTPHNPEPESAD